jgi:hypothetical protein
LYMRRKALYAMVATVTDIIAKVEVKEDTPDMAAGMTDPMAATMVRGKAKEDISTMEEENNTKNM